MKMVEPFASSFLTNSKYKLQTRECFDLRAASGTITRAGAFRLRGWRPSGRTSIPREEKS